MGLFSPTKPSAKAYGDGHIYDYSTPESRVATAEWLFEQAKLERTLKEDEWVKHDSYYNFGHEVAKEIADAIEEQGLPWTPACVPDPYIMVESQIIPDVPQPEFHGRDDDKDSILAKKREFAVKYVVEANRLADMNTSNERRLRKLGDAFWKAYYDETMPFGEKRGNIRIRDVACENIYPDPTAGAEGLQNGEYVDYVYSMHKMRFLRLYKKDLQRLGLTLDDIVDGGYREEGGLLEPATHPSSMCDDMVQILEHWFRQPEDTAEAPAGCVACTIQAGGVELRYIPNYWKNTHKQCDLFPFVHYWCIRDETQFWNKSELEPIIPLVDAADRELATGILNNAMTANDIVLVEEGALRAGTQLSNVPGEVVEVKQGRMGGVARLGGLATGARSLGMVEWLQNQIQRTNRNYDSNNGRETSRITTASGLLQLRTDAESQRKIKKADRDAGFCRLYELIDWLCLEFFDEDRLLFIGAKTSSEEPSSIVYNSNEFAHTMPGITDVISNEKIIEPSVYYPRVDVTVTTGDGISKNPATTLEVLDKLAAVPVTEDNWKLLAAELEYLDIPQKQEIVEMWKRKFEPQEKEINPAIIEAIKNDPELREMLEEIVASPISQSSLSPDGFPISAEGTQPFPALTL